MLQEEWISYIHVVFGIEILKQVNNAQIFVTI